MLGADAGGAQHRAIAADRHDDIGARHIPLNTVLVPDGIDPMLDAALAKGICNLFGHRMGIGPRRMSEHANAFDIGQFGLFQFGSQLHYDAVSAPIPYWNS